jgi:hypothetical protein
MKSRRAITIICQPFSPASSTLLVKCWSATSKVSVIAVCIPDYVSMTLYHCRPHKRPGSSGQTCLVASGSQSVRFARVLATRFNARHSFTYMCLSGRVIGRETRVHAGRCHAGLSLRIGNNGRLLWIRQWTVAFLTVLGIYWSEKRLLLCCELLYLV